MVLIRSLVLVIKERPTIVITTGSFPLALVCFSSKLFGAKVVWIDSVANIERLSMSGRFVRCFADLCLAQWPECASKYKNVEYVGALL